MCFCFVFLFANNLNAQRLMQDVSVLYSTPRLYMINNDYLNISISIVKNEHQRYV